MLTAEDVVQGYRYILGREPESQDVVERHLSQHVDRDALRRTMMASPEFGAMVGYDGFASVAHNAYWSEPRQVETRVAPDVMELLVERIKRQWKALGEEEPYWSVLIDDAFKADVLDDKAIAEFRAGGASSASLVDRALAAGLPSKVQGICVELGCGVGRITRHLAKKFDKVIAIDISPGNLEICRQYMESEGVENVETQLLQSLDDLKALGPVDWFYSIMVLQHNPPPIQLRILENILGQIKPGGGFVFQTPSAISDYNFEAGPYLRTKDPIMEMHSLPQNTIFDLCHDLGLRIFGARTDPWISTYGSYTYEGYKPL